MDVSQILNLLGSLSIGLDDPSESDIDVYINYLNIAYRELLQETIIQNPNVPILTEVVVSTELDGVLPGLLTQDPFIIKTVFDSDRNVPLKPTNLDAIQRTDPGITKTGLPSQWYYSSGSINLYPKFAGNIGVTYIAQPALLDVNTISANILIPRMYQYILADGAAYYVFQSETGFKDQMKMAACSDRWQKGKRDLFSYYKNLGGQKFYSTYSAV